jgi:membrane dipeptidase
MLAAIHALARRWPERARLVGNGRELAAARAAGQVALLAGIEGGHAIEGSLEKLEWLFHRGLRVLTLVWNNHLDWIRSSADGAGPEVPEGLGPFGHDVVRRMGELGIVVDLSHAGERAFDDVLEAAERPPIASHSGCRTLFDHRRNLTDDQLRRLAAKGGVVGIVFCPGFLDAAAWKEEERVYASERYRSVPRDDPGRMRLAWKEIMREMAVPMPAGRLLDHVVHAVEVAGIEHVGLGSDFDGVDRGPEWIEDVSGYAVLTELLLRRGFHEDEAARILGGNLERVFAEVTGPGTLAHEATIVPIGAEGEGG